MISRVVSIRLPEELAQRADVVAGQSGMTLAEMVVHALDQSLTSNGDPTAAFFARIRSWVLATYPETFPEDVTRRVFQYIRTDADVFTAYQQCLVSAGEDRVYEMRTSVHRRIGLMVKRVLNATVVGRSLPLDPSQDLITSCALLRPTPAGEKEQKHG